MFMCDSPVTFFMTPPPPFPQRVFSLDTIEGYKPAVLAGHKEPVMGVFFTDSTPGDDNIRLLTVSKDGAAFKWRFKANDAEDANEAKEATEVPAFAGEWLSCIPTHAFLMHPNALS